jgi:hypothetical protein
MSWLTDRYIDGGAGINNLDWSNIAKDLGVAGAVYGLINPNDSSGIAKFLGTGGRQQPIGYTGGIPNYTATRELAPNAFAQTYTTPTGEVAPRVPGSTGRRYFTDPTFTQSTDTPFMGITAEQIAAQNQAALDEQALFESILGGVETQSAAARAAKAAAEQAAAATAAQQAATTPTGGTTDSTYTTGIDGSRRLTAAELKQAVLDGTMDYSTAYRELGIADAANPFGFTEEEQASFRYIRKSAHWARLQV